MVKPKAESNSPLQSSNRKTANRMEKLQHDYKVCNSIYLPNLTDRCRSHTKFNLVTPTVGMRRMKPFRALVCPVESHSIPSVLVCSAHTNRTTMAHEFASHCLVWEVSRWNGCYTFRSMTWWVKSCMVGSRNRLNSIVSSNIFGQFFFCICQCSYLAEKWLWMGHQRYRS